ncbi:MAG: hypothetical protein Q9169_007254 [Polycauliona sp. 2 TL-2023]
MQQSHTEATMMADESMADVDMDMAAEASIIPPPPPLSSHGPPSQPPRVEISNNGHATPSQPVHSYSTAPSSHLPPPTLSNSKLGQSQTTPQDRPDSAYGGSGASPSLLSNESIDTLPNDVFPPPDPLLPSPPQAHLHLQQPRSSHPAQYSQPSGHELHCQPQPSITDSDNNPAIDDPSPSDYADSAYDDAASLNGSITDTLESAYSRYRWENGRRYHSYRDGAYWGPNDETHNDQQDIAHHAWRLALNQKLYLAPIHSPERILDVGTGTGIWAIEMAELFPDAQVVGTDLSPIQPTWVPPNCIFEVDDVTMEWTYRKESFDFIHSREMFGSIADWDEHFRQCYLHLKPGGCVEALERGVKPVSDDGTVGPDHFWTTWGNTVLSVGETWGKGFNAWEVLKDRMEAAGFVDVVQIPMKWPIGPWMQDKHMKELGMWNALRLDTGLEGYVMRLFTMAGGTFAAWIFSLSSQNSSSDTHLPHSFTPSYLLAFNPNDHIQPHCLITTLG